MTKIFEQQKNNETCEKVIEVLYNSINDWPITVAKLEDYESEVKYYIGGDVNKSRVESFLLKIDLSKDAWKAESLSQLSEVFQFYPTDFTLAEIIIELRLNCPKCLEHLI
jgi:hypothetical protein